MFAVADSESVNLMNHEYGDGCSRNKTVAESINKFATKFDKIRRLSYDEVSLLRRKGFRTNYPDVCETKRNVARSMTAVVQPIADYCVSDSSVRQKFVLNTLMIVQTTLDFICGMNQSHFEAIYEQRSERCFAISMPLLRGCQRKSFDLYFWEAVPTKLPTVTKLVNGAVCK